MHITEVKVRIPRFRIVHHIKNLVSVGMSMIFLLLKHFTINMANQKVIRPHKPRTAVIFSSRLEIPSMNIV